MHAARSATLFLLLSCGAFAQAAIPAGSPASAPPPCDVRLTIAAKASRISAEEWAEVTGTLENTGSRRVVLVEPGDGSEVGWRTPVIRWTTRRIAQGRAAEVTLKPEPRCGLMNGPYAKAEVFTLAPGHSRRLRMLTPPRLGPPGVYEIALTYTNDPKMPFRGTDPGDPAVRPYRQSTACTVTSNALRIEVR
jgi:hypothetical protein